MTELAGYFLLFAGAAVIFLLVPLLLGKLLRPKLPTEEKVAIYECGEPTIGSSYIQFDLRFYVVALLFIIFDVEVAFFFPWALVFGGASQLADARLSEAARTELSGKLLTLPEAPAAAVISAESARTLAWFGLFDILVFFGVLLVGFIYVWKRGDLDWVRAVTREVKEAAARPKAPPVIEREREPVGS
jgi:NADH-quinone oxidoreductase subunit A